MAILCQQNMGDRDPGSVLAINAFGTIGLLRRLASISLILSQHFSVVNVNIGRSPCGKPAGKSSKADHADLVVGFAALMEAMIGVDGTRG